MARRSNFSVLGLLVCLLTTFAAAAPPDEVWWSLRPLVGTKPQAVRNRAWGKNPVDEFILAQLERHGLSPAPPADKRTLLRRLYLDMTGLPPTPDELQAFESDPAANAYEKVVDQLLASPRYGERMARRWMDLVHFAESHGHDEDKHRLNAWPYRDYLIRAFNDDKPYARFIQEQIAGDALFPDDADGAIALGLLAAGPWDQSSQMGIMDGTLDKQIARYLDRDDIVTTVMSTFCSVTVHCARCHDHKFDPIKTDDYYALQAVFAGVERVDRGFDPDPMVAKRRRELRRQREQLEKVNWASPQWLADDAQNAARLWERTQSHWSLLEVKEAHSAGGATLERLPDGSIRSAGTRPDKERVTIVATTTLQKITAVRLEILTDPGLPHQGPGRQDNGNFHLNEVRIQAAIPGHIEWPRKIAQATSDFDQAGWGIDKAIDGDPATAWGIYPQVGKPHVAVFEFTKPVLSADTLKFRVILEQQHGQGHVMGRFRLSATDGPSEKATVRPKELTEALATEADKRTDPQRKLLAREAALAQLDMALLSLPPQQKVYAIASDFPADGNFKPPHGPRKVEVLRRGDIRFPLRDSAPGALTCVTALPARFDLHQSTDEAARRVALARWLTDRNNPLTWRSIANRLWQWHFGKGIVATPNDFGKMGDEPTHPALLDWLASQLRTGASLKAVQRMLVTSATYRQASTGNAAAIQTDPANQWLARMNRGRLDAEMVHDGILQIAGKLDLKMYGPSVKLFKEKPGNHVTPVADYHHFDVDTSGANRRSVYRFLFRTVPDPFMDVLDCPDASQLAPKRGESTTALQALSLLNSPFMTRMSEHLAGRIQNASGSALVQIDTLFRLVLLRSPTSDELTTFQTFIARHGLASACRVLLNCNEFHFVE